MNAQLMINRQHGEIYFSDTRMEGGLSQAQLGQELMEGFLLLRYLRADLSLGELAEFLGLEIASAMAWLQARAVPGSRLGPVAVQGIHIQGRARLAKALGS